MLAVPGSTTIDAFLGGRVEAIQPAARHHRSGLDAILLAAAIGNGVSGRIVDLGAGAGVAGFALAARAPRAELVLAEREPELTACAGASLALPQNVAFASRVRIAEADLLSGESRLAADLLPGAFDHALMNPPFHDGESVRSSPKEGRARAHVLGEGGLDLWFRAAAALVRPGGTLAVILPAARLADLFAAADGRFGGLAVLPVHARAGEAAIRVLARGTKGSRAACRLMPGLVLHGAAGNAFAPAASAMLRDGASLHDVHPAWFAAAWPDGRASEPASPLNFPPPTDESLHP